jgi:hypothetical protein
MFSIISNAILVIFYASRGVWGNPRGISLRDKVYAVEDLFTVEGTVDFPVNPCTVFLGPQNTGELTSAEWVRIIFHDFITADVAAGTG